MPKQTTLDTTPIQRTGSTSSLHIKRPRNAFIIYRCDKLRELSSSTKGLEESKANGMAHMPQGQKSKIIGNMWNQESSQVKAEYHQRADDEAAAHKRNHPDYKYRPNNQKHAVRASRGGKRKRQSQDSQCEDKLLISSSAGPSTLPTMPPMPENSTTLDQAYWQNSSWDFDGQSIFGHASFEGTSLLSSAHSGAGYPVPQEQPELSNQNSEHHLALWSQFLPTTSAPPACQSDWIDNNVISFDHQVGSTLGIGNWDVHQSNPPTISSGALGFAAGDCRRHDRECLDQSLRGPSTGPSFIWQPELDADVPSEFWELFNWTQ